MQNYETESDSIPGHSTRADRAGVSADAIADDIAKALLHFDGRRYPIFAWCVMPKHVHVVLNIFSRHTLPKVMHSWKSFTSKRASEVSNVGGTFWQTEYYDHFIRDESEL